MVTSMITDSNQGRRSPMQTRRRPASGYTFCVMTLTEHLLVSVDGLRGFLHGSSSGIECNVQLAVDNQRNASRKLQRNNILRLLTVSSLLMGRHCCNRCLTSYCFVVELMHKASLSLSLSLFLRWPEARDQSEGVNMASCEAECRSST
jgi:hypothetical protein